MKAMMSTKGRETLLSPGEFTYRYLLSLRLPQTVPLSQQDSVPSATSPVDRATSYWIPDGGSQTIGLDGAIGSKWYAFPSRKHMTERPIHGLSMRHQPDNQPSFQRYPDSSCRLEAFPAPGLRDRASFRRRGRTSKAQSRWPMPG